MPNEGPSSPPAMPAPPNFRRHLFQEEGPASAATHVTLTTQALLSRIPSTTKSGGVCGSRVSSDRPQTPEIQNQNLPNTPVLQPTKNAYTLQGHKSVAKSTPITD